MNENELLALLVDDNPDVLSAKQQYFASRGLRALTAVSKEEALRHVKSTPALDIVVTDIDLRGESSKRPDNEGEILALEIRKFRSDLPVVAYTARKPGDFLRPVNWNAFTRTLSKGGGMEDIARDFETCLEVARDYKKRRVEIAKLELERLQQKYEIPDYDIATLQAFLPGVTTSSRETETEGAEELLRRAGYHLRFIEAGVPVDGGVENTVMTAFPVPIWVRHEGDCYVAELYGHPCIYADGPTEEDAVAAVASLMYGYHQDFTTEPDRFISVELRHLRDDLVKFFR